MELLNRYAVFTVLSVIVFHPCRGYDYPAEGEYQHLYSYGPPDTTVANDDDGSSPEIPIPPFKFFGVPYTSLHVNINGDISFGQAYSSYTPITFPMSNGVPLVAVYLTDLHTARTGDEEIYYREDNTTEILERASADVYAHYGEDYANFQATWTFIATYHNISQYRVDAGRPYVTFQIVLITDGDATFCRFNYGTLQFDSGSSNGIPAQIGFDAGDRINYRNHLYSMTSGVLGLEGKSLTYRIDEYEIRLKYQVVVAKRDAVLIYETPDHVTDHTETSLQTFTGVYKADKSPHDQNHVIYMATDDGLCMYNGTETPATYTCLSESSRVPALSLDWINDNIYYVMDDKLYIYSRRQLVNIEVLQDESFTSGVDMAVDPREDQRYIYVACDDTIIRCALDCSENTLVTRSTPAIAITLDLWHDVIYYYNPLLEEIRSVMMSKFTDRFTYTTVQSIPSVNSLSIITDIFLLSTQTNTSSVLVRDLVNDTQIPVYLTDDEGFDWPCKSVKWLNWEGIDVLDICSDECGSDVCVPTNTTHLACYNPNDSTKSYQAIYVDPTPSEKTDSEETVFLVVIHKLQLLWHVDYLDSDSARYYQLKTQLTGIMSDMLVSYRSTVTSHIFSPGSVIVALGIATPVSMLDDLIETLMVFTGNDLLVIDSVFTNIILSLNTTGCSVVGSVCLQCQEGTCGSCETPHYATPSGQCRECNAYGQACSACKIDSCVTCEGPYYVSQTGTCEECTDYGEECSRCDVDTCLRCADEYYAASDGACRENPLRCRDYMQYCIHGSCFDNHEGIHCQCPTHFDGEQCQDPVTIIDSLSPAIGVQAGGTRITIKGHHLNINDIPEIHTRSNRLICNESDGTDSEFTCLTIPGEASAVGRADQLTLYWAATDVELHLDRGQTFTYKENPVVENIHPLHVTPEGGIELTIVGENLEAVGDPTLLTNLVIRAEDINDNYTTACQLDADDILKCPSAKLEIPPDVSLVDSCVNDNSGILCDVELHMGLQLDGFDAYQNIEEALPEQGRLVAVVPPRVDYNEKEILYQTWWPKKPEQIQINGKNLKIFEASFEIWVGKSQSDLLKKDVYDNVMFFSPTKDKSAYQHGSSSTYDIQVILGNKNYTAGHINFEFSIWDCGDCQLGLCFGIAGVVLIALIVMCIKRERFKKCLQIGRLNNEDSTEAEPEEPKYLDMMRTQFTHITSTFNRMSVTGAPRNQHVRQARQARHNYGETSKDAYERREKRRNHKRHKTKAKGGLNPLHTIPYSESIEMSSVNVQRRVKHHYYKDQENPDVYNKNLTKNPKRKFPGNHQRYPNQLPTQHDQYRVDIEWDEAGNRESFTDDDYAADWYHDNNNGDRSDPWVTTPYQHPRRQQQDHRERNRMYKY